MKTCTKCGVEQELSEFYFRKDTETYRKVCKTCCRNISKSNQPPGSRINYARSYYEKNRYKVLEKQKLKRYGVDEDWYNQVLEEQGGCCAICKSPEPGSSYGRFHIDHCHETGKVRSLLCNHCNRGLGAFRDDPNILSNAISYLTTHSN